MIVTLVIGVSYSILNVLCVPSSDPWCTKSNKAHNSYEIEVKQFNTQNVGKCGFVMNQTYPRHWQYIFFIRVYLRKCSNVNRDSDAYTCTMLKMSH